MTRPTPANSSPASPLGRYGDPARPAGGGGGEEDGQVEPVLTDVQLLGVPVRVLAAGREHHDALLREFRLLALSGSLDRHDPPARLVELTQQLGVRYAAARSRPDAAVDRALDEGRATVDLTYPVPASAADAARALEALLAEADEFCRSRALMTLPRSPVVARFARWYLDQFTAQIAGGPPTPWDGPHDPD